MQEIDSRRRETFADTLDLLLPYLPPTLVTQSAISLLQAAAQWLPPIPHGGFECRLQSASPQVDLQQSIYAKDHEPEILVKHLANLTNASPSLPPTWKRLSNFCLEWGDTKSTLHSEITEIWLELDLPSGVQSPAPEPVVFIGLTRTDLPAEKILAVVNRSVELLLGDPLSAQLEMSLMRCLSGLPEKGHLRHFGVMAARPSAALRINLQLSVDGITPYLKRCGWPGQANELDLLLADCYPRVGGLTVCLDVDESIRPQVGLECFFGDSAEGELRSRSMLTWLVDQGLCTSEKRDALLAWAGSIAPATTSAPWPDHLISAALLQPSDRFSLIHRRLHHLKLTYDGTQRVTAKAYFGAIHDWCQSSKSQNEDGTKLSPATTAEPGLLPGGRSSGLIEEQIETAIASATSYLLAAQLSGGWQDYSEIGASDEWVTAYVAAALASISDPRARQAARSAWSFLLERRRSEGGWGYGAHTPADADSTIWSLRLGDIINEGLSERAKQANQFLVKHQHANGGIATYLDGKPIREFTSRVIPAPLSVDGWCAIHPCVTAAGAALASVAEGCRRFLIETQRSDGSWPAYWWGDEDYTTALAAEALATQPKARACVELAVQWARRRIGKRGSVNSIIHGGESAFATAWCVRTLALDVEPTALQLTINWLSENQLADGSWLASARLRVPAPDELDAEANPQTLIALDTSRVFTTATVLAALEAARVTRRTIHVRDN